MKNKLDKKIKQKILLYSSEKEAEENIENYLQNPPQLFAYLKDAKWVKVPLPKILAKKNILCAKPIVESPYFNSRFRSLIIHIVND